MRPCTVSFRGPAGREPPSVEGLEVVDGRWRLATDVHHELLVDVTGVDPRGGLTLQELATITARLEGYVEAAKRTPEPTPATEPRTAILPDHWLVGPVQRFVTLLRRVLPGRQRRASRSPGTERRAEPEWAVERVHKLSKVFRAATDARRQTIAATQPPSSAPALD